MLREEALILDRSHPMIKGDFAIAQMDMCARSSFSVSPLLPTNWLHVSQ
jgi:hypothetical protein